MPSADSAHGTDLKPEHPMLPYLVDLEEPYRAEEAREYDPVELIRFALTMSDYWAGLGLRWLEQGLPSAALRDDLHLFEGTRHRAQTLRHRARRLAETESDERGSPAS